MKEILMESYAAVKKASGIDPSRPGALRHIIAEDSAWNSYISSLAESLETKSDAASFRMLAENTRQQLLESAVSSFGMNPYESLTLPLLRVFYPKLVGKELVTVSPISKPEVMKAWIKATFSQANSTVQYNAPVMTPDISRGPSIGTPVTALLTVPSANYDVLAVLSLTKDMAHLERDFVITQVSADGTTYVDVNIVPAVEGHFSSSVPLDDVISGFVDYKNGTVSISSATGAVVSVKYTVTCSLQENRMNPKIDMTIEKVRLNAVERQIQANWTIPAEQDMRALFDVSMQAEIVNFLSQQIALDIDREIITDIIYNNLKLNGSTHQGSFTRNPPTGYTWGIKNWHENIIPELTRLSGTIYNDTNMNSANVILANPVDAAILENLQTYNFTGSSSMNGEMGYRSATLQGGKWKVLVSGVVPAGTMLLGYKSEDEMQACYYYSPYIPLVLHPYPMTYTPSLTILSRYAKAMVREKGFAALTIS
jgi:hypothetical protein